MFYLAGDGLEERSVVPQRCVNKLNKKVKDEASSLHNELREKIEFWLRVKKHSRQLIEDGKNLERSH